MWVKVLVDPSVTLRSIRVFEVNRRDETVAHIAGLRGRLR
jgi:hypothetical protein